MDYPVIATYLGHQGFSSIVERVTYAQNKTAIDLTGFDVRLELNKDNTYTMTNSHKLFNQLITVEKKGNWFFRQEKKTLKLCESLTHKTEEFTIVFLKKGELQLQQVTTNEGLNKSPTTKLFFYKAN